MKKKTLAPRTKSPKSPFLAPNQLPTLDMLLHATGSPLPKHIAKLLGVHERTVYQWQAKGQAPRSALLALFWESSYGRQWLYATLSNEASMHAQLSRALQDDCKALRSGALAAVASPTPAVNAATFDAANVLPLFQA